MKYIVIIILILISACNPKIVGTTSNTTNTTRVSTILRPIKIEGSDLSINTRYSYLLRDTVIIIKDNRQQLKLIKSGDNISFKAIVKDTVILRYDTLKFINTNTITEKVIKDRKTFKQHFQSFSNIIFIVLILIGAIIFYIYKYKL